MKLKKLWIKEYNKYNDTIINFDDNVKVTSFQKEIFGNMNVTLFSGENGAGKTTILSFIAIIFRYLQRFRERIPCEYELQYSIVISKKEYDIRIKFENGKLFMIINGIKYLVQEYCLKKRQYIFDEEIGGENQVTYDEIKKYLPKQVVVIGFDAAYVELGYSGRYIGDRLVDYRELEGAYGTTGRGNDYSKGVLTMCYLYSKDRKIKSLFRRIGIEFAEYVDIKININGSDVEKELRCGKSSKNIQYFLESKWTEYVIGESDYNSRFLIFEYIKNKKNYLALHSLIDEKYIYINEYYIIKDGKVIPISGMSTGEKAFLYNLFFLLDRIDNDSVVIWEEPETHLNMLWSKNLVPLLVQLFGKYDFHILLSSHDTYMIRNLFQNQIRILKDNKVMIPNFNTFLANESEIMNYLFEDKVLNDFEDYTLRKMKQQSRKEQEELMDILGESYLKFLLYKQMEK